MHNNDSDDYIFLHEQPNPPKVWHLWPWVVVLLLVTAAWLSAATVYYYNDSGDKLYRLRISYTETSGTAIYQLFPPKSSGFVVIPNGHIDQAYFQWTTDDGSYSWALGSVLSGPLLLTDSSILSARFQAESGDNFIELRDTGFPDHAPAAGGSTSEEPTEDQIMTFTNGFYLSVSIGIFAIILALVRKMGAQNHNPS